jgi:hypothetical protein
MSMQQVIENLKELRVDLEEQAAKNITARNKLAADFEPGSEDFLEFAASLLSTRNRIEEQIEALEWNNGHAGYNSGDGDSGAEIYSKAVLSDERCHSAFDDEMSHSNRKRRYRRP